MMDTSILWSNILDKIKSEINSLSYQTWFEETELYEFKNGIAKIVVQMPIQKNHINLNYSELIKNCFLEITGKNIEIELIFKDDIIENQFNVQNEEINKNIEQQNVYISNNLNPKYTFESFIVGNTNKFAHAAALAVAENPGKIYNPLFIYGNSGLGKTHLMHAIGNYITKNSNKKVLYVTSEQFVSDFIGINKKDESGTNFSYVDFFKQKYRNIDVLIIDDIQYLGGATETQKEFFHTFNSLYGDNKQIIISSDKSPNN